MRKLILATTAAATLALGVGAAGAAEPGTDQYFHERGNFDASLMQRGPAPDLSGWPAQSQQGPVGYGYQAEYGYGPMGYAPSGHGSGTYR